MVVTGTRQLSEFAYSLLYLHNADLDNLANLPFQIECNKSLGDDFDRLSPELDLWVNGTMKYKEWSLDMKRTDRRMVAHLLAYDSNS